MSPKALHTAFGLLGLMKDTVLDKSVFFSFDQSGFLRHQENFDPQDLGQDLTGRVAIVTGANSGIGFETAQGLVQRGAKIYFVCRNHKRGEAAISDLKARIPYAQVVLKVCDVADLESIQTFASQLDSDQVDILVHNAGALYSTKRFSPQGFELTFATHVLGPFALNHLLLDHLKASGDARVITVSSGGMYLQKLSLEKLQALGDHYDGVTAYSQTKRAQVILNELFSEKYLDLPITFSCMHPGWAATPGVEKSLPRFWSTMKDRLRTPAQGADTVLWLAISPQAKNQTGLFWFDRQEVKTHVLPNTRESQKERLELWNLCKEKCNSYIKPLGSEEAVQKKAG